MFIPAKMEITKIKFHPKRRRRIIRAIHETGHLQLIDIQQKGQDSADARISISRQRPDAGAIALGKELFNRCICRELSVGRAGRHNARVSVC